MDEPLKLAKVPDARVRTSASALLVLLTATALYGLF